MINVQELGERYAENIVDRLEEFLILKDIEDYNQGRDEDDKIKVEYGDYFIGNPFYDETGRGKVNPFKYYGPKVINKFIDKWR